MDSEKQRPLGRIGRTALIFFVRFIIASAALYLLYTRTGSSYVRFIAGIAKPILSLNGIELDLQRTLKVTEEISLNPVVFLSLVLATQHVPALRRTVAAIAGFSILTAANALIVFLLFMSATRGSELLWTGTEFLNLTMNFFFPLLLWIAFLPSYAFATMRGGIPEDGGQPESQTRP